MPGQDVDFFGKFSFSAGLAGHIGIERERFLIDPGGSIVAAAPAFLGAIRNTSDRWTYELSACQAEDRTPPLRKRDEIRAALEANDALGRKVAADMGLDLVALEAAPSTMPFDLYPDPRYANIAERIGEERLHAACRVAGTHIHYGVRDFDHAFVVYHRLRPYLESLARLGDHSMGERLSLYKSVAPEWYPPRYENREDFLRTAIREGFSEDPRSCYHLIRISRHGTVECRMFGTTENVEEVLSWRDEIVEIATQGKED